jgi:hypothetical protein
MTARQQVAPTLRQLQQWMASLILHPQRLEAETPEAVVALPTRGTVNERLRVYSRGYPARVQEALRETFPALAHVIGSRALSSLTERYVRATRLRSYSLNDVGAALPGFIGHDPLATEFPFLPDLAQLEWRVAQAFHAWEQPPMDPQRLAKWGLREWSQATLRFQASVGLVSSAWPIRDLWRSRHTPVEEIDVDLCDRPDRVLVRRTGFDVSCESVPADEASVLTALLAGQRLGEITELLALQGSDPGLVSTWFARWMAAGMIVSCEQPPASPADQGG